MSQLAAHMEMKMTVLRSVKAHYSITEFGPVLSPSQSALVGSWKLLSKPEVKNVEHSQHHWECIKGLHEDVTKWM